MPRPAGASGKTKEQARDKTLSTSVDSESAHWKHYSNIKHCEGCVFVRGCRGDGAPVCSCLMGHTAHIFILTGCFKNMIKFNVLFCTGAGTDLQGGIGGAAAPHPTPTPW